MLDTPPADVPLLRADDIEISRAAVALETGAMVIVVASAPRADKAAREAFGNALGEGWHVKDVALDDPNEVASRLRENAPAEARSVVRLVLDRDHDVLDALNLHREKLRVPGSRFALWVAGREAYRELMRRAPDAFSFRDSVAIVEGDEPALPIASIDEPEDLRSARSRLARALAGESDARATAWSDLVKELFGFDSGQAAREASALIAWAEVLPAPSDAVKRALARALYYGAPDRQCHPIRSRRDSLRALALLDGLTSYEERRLRLLVRANVPAPPGYSHDLTMIATAEGEVSSPAEGARIERARFATFLARDDTRHALPPKRVAGTSAFNRALSALDGATRLSALGRPLDARRAAREISALTEPKTLRVRRVARVHEALCTLRLGEAAAARRIAEELSTDPHTDVDVHALVCRVDALARAMLGDVQGAIDALRANLRFAHERQLPTAHLDALRSLAALLRDAQAAGVIDDAALDASDHELETEATLGISLAGDDPPWFPILYAGIRAEHMGARDARLADAIALQRTALALADERAPILAPEAGRLLARLLLCSGDHAEATRFGEHLEAPARAERVLREVIKLRAVRLLAAVTQGQADVGPELRALRNAFDESGAVPVEVEVSRDVGEELVRLGRADIARDLAGSALVHTEEMPWPEEQGRCLELLGRCDEATAHYERWGFTLRRRILEARRPRAPSKAPARG